MPFTAEDQARVAAAIAEAESRTAGEIYCIHARSPHRYVEWLLALTATIAFLVPLVAAMLGFGPEAWVAALLGGGWRDAHGALPERTTIELFAGAQALLFLLLLAAFWWSPLAQRRAPLALRQRRVHELASLEFFTRGLHLTEERTGVMLFVSVDDHVAEVVADEGIHRFVDEAAWVETVAAMLAALKHDNPAQGFVDAIAIAGGLLAAHVPPRPGNPDELPNRLVVM
ncbi:MAG: TPM domain-containing protein [Thermaurantiacus sp.]